MTNGSYGFPTEAAEKHGHYSAYISSGYVGHAGGALLVNVTLDAAGCTTEILAASFKTAREVLEVALTGAGAATVSADVMKKLLSHTTTDTSIAGFAADWEKAFGKRTLASML